MFKGMKIYAILFTITAILWEVIEDGWFDWDYTVETIGTMVLISIPIFVVTWIAQKIYEHKDLIKEVFLTKKEES